MIHDNNMNNERLARLEQASIDSAHEGLKALLLLNGGACVAVLGFLATTLKDAKAGGFEGLVSGMMASLVWFSVGAGLAVLTALFSYLTNQAYVASMLDPRVSWWRGLILNWLAMACPVFSLASFAYGIYVIALTVPF
jgi:hypothetical protein